MSEVAEKKLSDIAFIDSMIAHHEGAIFVATQSKELSKRPEIKQLSTDIITAQQKEIDTLYGWKLTWFSNARKVNERDVEKVNLGAFDEQFDLRFLNAMVMHHMDAVTMAKQIRTTTIRQELITLADAIITTQMREVEKMQQWQRTWYDSDHDYTYIKTLLAHHQGAIALLEQAQQQSRRPEIRQFAQTVIQGEKASIDELYQWKKNWYNDTALVPAKASTHLGEYDDQFDLRFLNALIPQLQDAVDMAKEMKVKTMRSDVESLTDTVQATIPGVIVQLQNWRKSWYNVDVTVTSVSWLTPAAGTQQEVEI
jgi:uncharacterized protein (DUF305 family)